MNRASFVFLIAIGALGVSRGACAQADPERGRREFESSCAVCHGVEATGDGPLRPFLRKPPPDLTTLARRAGGTFPAHDVMAMIDGRSSVRIGSHGTREMPAWGQVYLESAQDEAARTKVQPEGSVHARIMALVDYLARLQR